jgi:hypothetical protein
MHAVWPSTQEDVDQEFLAIVCSDDALLAAEFEAIIDGSWPSTPLPRPPAGGPGRRRRVRDAGRRRARTPPAERTRAVRAAGRERSPPRCRPSASLVVTDP